MITLFLICIVACLVWKVKTQDENSVKSTPTVTEEKRLQEVTLLNLKNWLMI